MASSEYSVETLLQFLEEEKIRTHSRWKHLEKFAAGRREVIGKWSPSVPDLLRSLSENAHEDYDTMLHMIKVLNRVKSENASAAKDTSPTNGGLTGRGNNRTPLRQIQSDDLLFDADPLDMDPPPPPTRAGDSRSSAFNELDEEGGDDEEFPSYQMRNRSGSIHLAQSMPVKIPLLENRRSSRADRLEEKRQDREKINPSEIGQKITEIYGSVKPDEHGEYPSDKRRFQDDDLM